jgi:hypothetical protein
MHQGELNSAQQRFDDIPNAIVYSKLEMAKEIAAFELWLNLMSEQLDIDNLSGQHLNALTNLSENYCQTQAGKYAIAALNISANSNLYIPPYYGTFGGLEKKSNIIFNQKPVVHFFTINPNPTDQYAQIELSLEVKHNSITFEIHNNIGKHVDTIRLDGDQKRTLLNTNQLPNAVYIVSLLVDGKIIESQTLYVQH